MYSYSSEAIDEEMLNKVMYTDRLSAVIGLHAVSVEIYFKVHLITKKLNPVPNIISKS